MRCDLGQSLFLGLFVTCAIWLVQIYIVHPRQADQARDYCQQVIAQELNGASWDQNSQACVLAGVRK